MLLVFGSKGQLASALKATSLAPRARFLGSDEVDFADVGSLHGALDRHRPKAILNAAAYTQVDRAEDDKRACELVNAEAVGAIGHWARENRAKVVHFSTDYVFPGTGTRPWAEDDATGPLNWYGETKLRGERLLKESGCHAVTFRTSWLFSEVGTNFVKTMLRLGNSREHLDVVADQVGNPTYAPDVADFVARHFHRIESGDISGIFHLTNRGSASWHELASFIFATAAEKGHPLKIKSVAPIPSSQYPTPARRPLNSRLCLERSTHAFGEALPDWKDAVGRCLSKMGSIA